MCKYCNGSHLNIEGEETYTDTEAFLEGDCLRIFDIIEEYTINYRFKINYCPMCGRKLERNK